MATESTKDAVIVVPEGQTPPSIVETGDSTTATYTAPVSGATTEVSGNLVVAGATVTSSTFSFTQSGKVDFTNTVKSSKVLATSGSDSVVFSDGKSVKNKVKLGDGADSVVFGTKTKNTQVKLGKDNAADVVNIENPKDVKNLKLKNFGRQDTLIVGGKEFSYNDLQDRNFKNITIKFD